MNAAGDSADLRICLAVRSVPLLEWNTTICSSRRAHRHPEVRVTATRPYAHLEIVLQWKSPPATWSPSGQTAHGPICSWSRVARARAGCQHILHGPRTLMLSGLSEVAAADQQEAFAISPQDLMMSRCRDGVSRCPTHCALPKGNVLPTPLEQERQLARTPAASPLTVAEMHRSWSKLPSAVGAASVAPSAPKGASRIDLWKASLNKDCCLVMKMSRWRSDFETRTDGLARLVEDRFQP